MDAGAVALPSRPVRPLGRRASAARSILLASLAAVLLATSSDVALTGPANPGADGAAITTDAPAVGAGGGSDVAVPVETTERVPLGAPAVPSEARRRVPCPYAETQPTLTGTPQFVLAGFVVPCAPWGIRRVTPHLHID